MGYHPSHFAIVYWSVLLTVFFGGFFAYEITSIATGHPENTLSAYIWNWLGVMRGQPITQWSFTHFAFLGIFTLTAGWLIGHFGWGIWT
jgi:hypothetical protein